MTDSTQRFSSRVDNYVKYRPSYPETIVPLLARECGLTPQAVIADIGSGTGLLAQLWLQHGNSRVRGLNLTPRCGQPANAYWWTIQLSPV